MELCRLRGDRRGAEKWLNLLVLNQLRVKFDPAIPPDINFEINTNCNYQCPFCPQAKQPRPPRYVSMEAFQYLVSEFQGIAFSGRLVLSVSNEPFLHPQVVDFCRYVSEQLPHATTCLISNGSLITKEHLKAFARLAHPPSIIVNDYTSGHTVYRRLAGWLTDPSLEGVRIEIKKRSRNEVLSNRAGNLPGGQIPDGHHRGYTCPWPFSGIWINSSLDVFLCCSDYLYENVFGNLNRDQLMDIWNSSALQEVRNALLVPDRSQTPLCAKCNAEWWVLPRHCE